MVAPNKKTLTLSSGYEIPMLGFGTSIDVPEAYASVKTALETGYRHLDCAAAYEDEVEIGRAIAASGVPRSEIFVTSKLWNTEHEPADVEPALDSTLKDLGLDYVDLYLIHWPSAWKKQVPHVLFPKDPEVISIPIADTWAAMEKLVESGKARSIGVSNFSRAEIEELLKIAKIAPAVNQIRTHPYILENEFIAWSLSKNIQITAWGPLLVHRGKHINVAQDPALVKLAKTAGITPAQLAISWAVQRGTIVIPSSTKTERIKENFKVVELSKEVFDEIQKLDTMPKYDDKPVVMVDGM